MAIKEVMTRFRFRAPDLPPLEPDRKIRALALLIEWAQRKPGRMRALAYMAVPFFAFEKSLEELQRVTQISRAGLIAMQEEAERLGRGEDER